MTVDCLRNYIDKGAERDYCLSMPADTKPTAAARLLADFIAALSHPDMKPVTDEATVKNRLYGLGFSEQCSRCWGSGSFGPLSVKAGVCFRCGGFGKYAPALTRTLCKRVQVEVTADILGAYAEVRKAAGAAKRAAKGAGARVSEGYSKTLFMQHFYSEEGTGRRNDVPYSPLAFTLHNCEEAAVRAFHTLEFAAKRGDAGATPEAILAAEAEVVRIRALQDRVFAAVLSSGEVAASAAENERIRAMRDRNEPGSYDIEERARRATNARAAELIALAEWAAGDLGLASAG